MDHVGLGLTLWVFGCWILEGRSAAGLTLKFTKLWGRWIDKVRVDMD